MELSACGSSKEGHDDDIDEDRQLEDRWSKVGENRDGRLIRNEVKLLEI